MARDHFYEMVSGLGDPAGTSAQGQGGEARGEPRTRPFQPLHAPRLPASHRPASDLLPAGGQQHGHSLFRLSNRDPPVESYLEEEFI